MDAHEKEYAAAAAGMAEQYGTPADTAVGDQIWFRRADMTYAAPGRVVEITPLGALIIEDERGTRQAIFSDDIVRL